MNDDLILKTIFRIKGEFDLVEGKRILASPEEAERLLALINTKFSSRVLTAEEVYIFPSVLSTQAIDSYGTRMARSTIERFAQDVADGIPLMNSHRTGGLFSEAELPIGRKFDAEIIGDFLEVGEVGFDDQVGARLRTWNYMLRGVRVTDLTNDDIIASIEAGIIEDESVGFTYSPDGRATCSICGNDYYRSSDCPHIVFQTYALEDENGEPTGDIARCFAWNEDANAVEGSLVYAGATPGAMIDKARQYADTLDSDVLARLEDVYQTRLKDLSRKTMVPAAKIPPDGPAHSPRTNGENPVKEVKRMNVEELRALMLKLGSTEEELAEVFVEDRTVEEIIESMFRAYGETEKELRADAELGREVRKEIIEKIIKARVQAQGEQFSEDHRAEYEATLHSGSLPFLRAELATWQERAEAVLSEGPSPTRFEDESPRVMNEAYQ